MQCLRFERNQKKNVMNKKFSVFDFEYGIYFTRKKCFFKNIFTHASQL